MSNSLLNVFLAEDDEDDRMLFSEALEEISIKTSLSLFNHGQELLDYLFQPNNKLPDCIFLDLNMPFKNGIQCLTEIRKDPTLQSLNIVIYSTSSSQKDIQDAYENGANIYINKPACFTKLREVIENVLERIEELHISNINKDNFLLK